MNPASSRQRSGSEVVFGTLRVLIASYRLWGGAGGLTLDDLAALLGVRADRVADTVVFLLGEGLVLIRPGTRTIGLSDEGIEQFVRSPGAPLPGMLPLV